MAGQDGDMTYRATYRAWVWDRRGEPGDLRLEHRHGQAPGPGEVVIENRAIGLNPVDWKMIEWGHAVWKPGHVPGVDGAGIVVAVGAGVSLQEGARVAYHQGLARDGSFAERCLVRADALLAVPSDVSFTLAAALPCPGLTAWQALAKLPAAHGRDMLVTGAGGSVGRILAQLSLRAGWRVFVTSSREHHAGLLALGVSAAFDYRDDDWQGSMLSVLGTRRLHAAIDTVSAESASALAPLLGYNGHLVCIQDRLQAPPLPPFSTAISLHEVALNSAHEHADVLDWRDWREAGDRLMSEVRTGGLSLPPARLFGFDALPEALALLKSGNRHGKLAVAL
jgi:NADPH2:quinone reductase